MNYSVTFKIKDGKSLNILDAFDALNVCKQLLAICTKALISGIDVDIMKCGEHHVAITNLNMMSAIKVLTVLKQREWIEYQVNSTK